MKQSPLWCDSETFILTHLDLFNWGGFKGVHRAVIDPAGTAVIGPTGSGKTTLVDALMTLLCANPRYNLASTGGHESDRDLVSYVRGVSGPGDGGAGQSHIARQGKTITGVVATLACDTQQIRLGVLLWFEGTSSAATDMKKLWLFSDAPGHTLEHWLNVHHEGGMRALRQMEKEGTGIWTYPSKKSYLARLRDYFDVGENAFTLLNRAAGLKQLNSIDEIFRELVLDDHSAFERAAEVANSFDDLTEIYQELQIARKQIRSLQPIADSWGRYQVQSRLLEERQALEVILPIWFAEQAHGLWLVQTHRLEKEISETESTVKELQRQQAEQKKQVNERLKRYWDVEGGSVDVLKDRITDWQKTCHQREMQAANYQRLAINLDLSQELTAAGLQANQQKAETRLMALSEEISAAERSAFSKGITDHELTEQLQQLCQEKIDVERRPESNLPSQFQAFRSALATELGLDDTTLPFVAELVQVKQEEKSWRGAIERAIGSHRLRILVPHASADAALNWVNQRHNQLHVRLLEVKSPASQPLFFHDGFTKKLTYKEHTSRETVKALLADIDRHCVENTDQLRHTPHAMTAQGLMSGKARFFDKQDQKRLDEGWLTGFDNRDRLAFLAEQIQQKEQQLQIATQALRLAQAAVGKLQEQANALAHIQALNFESIDLPTAQRQLEELQARLDRLTHPQSDIAIAKAALDEAEARQKELERQYQQEVTACAGLKKDLERAAMLSRKVHNIAKQGMTGALQALGAAHFPQVAPEQLDDIQDIEREHARQLQGRLNEVNDRLQRLRDELIKRMSDAKKEDTGALSEVGRELDDIPNYLARLQALTEEALPEKLKRFQEYLNRSSDDGVTQLLSHIDHEVALIEERLEALNDTMRRVDFQSGRYLCLIAKPVVHDSMRTLLRTQRQLNSARFVDDDGESQYKALQALVGLLKDACERNRTQGARALLDPRFRLEFAVSVIERETGSVIETRTGSQGGSGGEKEIIASYVLTASLSYALCPDGRTKPLFGTIILDEAFSRSSHVVAGRIIAALREFGLHAVFITPNKEMRLLRHHTRSAIVVHRRGPDSSLVSLSWEDLNEHHQQRNKPI